MAVVLSCAACVACHVPDERFPVADAPRSECDLTQPFSPALPITELNDPTNSELVPRLSHDERTIYFWVRLANSTTGGELVTASRSTRAASFGPATNLAIDDATFKRDPTVTGDNLTLYFSESSSTAPGKIYAATRQSTVDEFATPTEVANLDTGSDDDDIEPYVLPNDQTIYLSASGNLYVSRRGVAGGAFAAPDEQPFANVNGGTGLGATSPVVSIDQLTLYFASTRAGGVGGSDIWTATRKDPTDEFGAPVDVGDIGAVNTPDFETPGWISDDGCRIYFARSPLGVHDWKLFVASKPAPSS
nr:hypothetical protein [Kofleriaceae bacterium]